MTGDVAPFNEIAELAWRYDAIVVLDDSHGLGVVGETGRGTPELHRLVGKIDVYTGTLGKALGAGTGGFVAGPRPVIDALKQRSRPHLFSNALPPPVAGAALAALELLEKEPFRVRSLQAKVSHFRRGLEQATVAVLPGQAAIVPVIVGRTEDAIQLSRSLLRKGVLAIGFGHPVVAENAARIRFQISDAHTIAELDSTLRVVRDCIPI